MLHRWINLVYALAVIGIPLAYVAAASFRSRKGWEIAEIIAFGLLFVFPDPILLLLWRSLYGMMAVSLLIFLGHIAMSVVVSFSPEQHLPVQDLVDSPTIAVLIPARNQAFGDHRMFGRAVASGVPT